MPAAIVHMLISRTVRNAIVNDLTIDDPDFKGGLNKNTASMELGSLGPDLPYYESMAKGAMDMLLSRSDKPMGVDQWSYQLHSKDPNVFPLKMIEIIWKETAIEVKDWDDTDRTKFAFVCGYLTHMAADQIIHPLVNRIAGPYYKRGDAREKHRECEVYQDIYRFNQAFPNQELSEARLNQWCDLAPGFRENAPIWLRYLLQKTFVEAHAVMPPEESIEDWLDGILTILRLVDNFGPYTKAYSALKAGVTTKFQEYVHDPQYDNYFQNAVALATIYVNAAYRIYNSKEIDDEVRHRFLSVVRNADLGTPLEQDVFEPARSALANWPSS